MPKEDNTKGEYAKADVNAPTNGQEIPSNNRRNFGRTYRAPTTMLCTFSLGLGLALTQHFLYNFLHGRSVASVFTSQAWISRIGTGLAFAVKVALTICVGSAFVQYQWWTLRRKPFRVVDIDTLTSASGNALCLVESSVWFRNPMLTIIALISWTIPLAAIVAPASLSVQSVQIHKTTPLQVPQLIYNLENYGDVSDAGGNYRVAEDGRITRLLTNTASSRAPVQLQSKYQNQTYDLQFHGPALNCSSANDSVVFDASMKHGNDAGGGPDMTSFASWVPAAEHGESSSLDFDSADAARMFIITNDTGAPGKLVEPPANSSLDEHYQVNVTECLLFNASYGVDFEFRYPNQGLTVRVEELINPISALTMVSGIEENFTNLTDVESYLLMMSAFGKLLVGQSSSSRYGYTETTSTGFNMLAVDWNQAKAVQNGLEQLFQNFTLSLLSDDGLIKNSSTADWIPVIVETWPITYVYTRTDLLLAYGLSLLAALICSGFGLYAFVANDASYQNIFSTYLRSMNAAGLNRYIDEVDKGHDPLPKRLREIKVNISDRKPDAEYIELSCQPSDI